MIPLTSHLSHEFAHVLLKPPPSYLDGAAGDGIASSSRRSLSAGTCVAVPTPGTVAAAAASQVGGGAHHWTFPWKTFLSYPSLICTSEYL